MVSHHEQKRRAQLVLHLVRPHGVTFAPVCGIFLHQAERRTEHVAVFRAASNQCGRCQRSAALRTILPGGERRLVTFWFVHGMDWTLREERELTVHKRLDGTEYVHALNRRHKRVRLTLDTPTEVFITKYPVSGNPIGSVDETGAQGRRL